MPKKLKKVPKESGEDISFKTPRKPKTNIEKTTLGDITDLASIKNEMVENEKKVDVQEVDNTDVEKKIEKKSPEE